MAFPTVQSATTTDFSSGSTTHNVSMPATVNPGDLLICAFCADGTPTITTPSGWTVMGSQQSFGSSTAVGGVYYKVADGSEDGTTVNWVTSTSQPGAAIVVRITGWGGTPEQAYATQIFGNLPDPPSLTPSWGALDTLWLAFGMLDTSSTGMASAPSSYSGYTKNASAGDMEVAYGWRQLNASSTNPGAFGGSTTNTQGTLAATIGIRPGGVVPVALSNYRRRRS